MEHLKIEISTSQSFNFPALVHLKSKFRSKFGPKSTPNTYKEPSTIQKEEDMSSPRGWGGVWAVRLEDQMSSEKLKTPKTIFFASSQNGWGWVLSRKFCPEDMSLFESWMAPNKISPRISLCARKFPVIFSATNAEHWSAYQ